MNRSLPVPKIDGLKIFQLKIHGDRRGFFTEMYKSSDPEMASLFSTFSQDNHSRSRPGVVRGLHYQTAPSQGKLIRVVRGHILDVVVDLRKDSSTFGRYFSIEISDENGILLWIPRGCAHGFSVLGSEDADIIYKINEPYSPKTETGIRYDDPDLGIDWKIALPILSEKDMDLPTFREYAKQPLF